MKNKSGLITAHPAVIAVWAALMAVGSLLPAFPIIGTGVTFNISNCLVPLAGIFFGPWVGAIVAGVGGFIGQMLAPHTVLFGPLQFTIAMLGAMGAGSGNAAQVVGSTGCHIAFWRNLVPPAKWSGCLGDPSALHPGLHIYFHRLDNWTQRRPLALEK